MRAFYKSSPRDAPPRARRRAVLLAAAWAGVLLTAWIGAHARADRDQAANHVIAVCRDCRAYAPLAAPKPFLFPTAPQGN